MAVCLCICQLTPAVLTSARFTGCLEGIMFNDKILGPWNFEQAHNIRGCDERFVTSCLCLCHTFIIIIIIIIIMAGREKEVSVLNLDLSFDLISFLFPSLFFPPFSSVPPFASFLALCRRPSVCLSSLCLSSVCRLSVTFVHPTQAIKIFRDVSTPFGTLTIHDLLVKILRRLSQGNPSIGRVKHKGLPYIVIFDLSNAISRKRCKIEVKLLLITNRKSHHHHHHQRISSPRKS